MATGQGTRYANQPGARLDWGASQGLEPAGEAHPKGQPRERTASLGLTVLPRATCCVPRAVSCQAHSLTSEDNPLTQRVHPNLYKPVILNQGQLCPQETLGCVWRYFWQSKLGRRGEAVLDRNTATHPTVSRTAPNTREIRPQTSTVPRLRNSETRN